jgi:hypothetical protein
MCVILFSYPYIRFVDYPALYSTHTRGSLLEVIQPEHDAIQYQLDISLRMRGEWSVLYAFVVWYFADRQFYVVYKLW